MRNFAMLIAAATMATAAPIAALHADPGSPGAPGAWWAQEALPFCQEQVSLDPNLSLGTCMSYFVTSDTGYLTQFCHYLDDQGILQEQGITFDECVIYFQKNN
jgi:hypothetical protein